MTDDERLESPVVELAASLLERDQVVLIEDQWFSSAPGASTPSPWHQDEPYYHLDRPRRLDRKDVRGRVVRHGIVDPTAMRALYDGRRRVRPGELRRALRDGLRRGDGRRHSGRRLEGRESPNLVDDGVEGKLVPEGDVAALAAALAEFASDENLRRRLGDAAWERTAARFFAVCRECAGDR